ncbi:MAG: AAA family ATPase [Clostridia bacterium]|nr:AAA family ATPase [Clostridia bacterium]
MKINNIKINSFGNLKDKEIELSENINIIQGKNESGKSTLLKFIVDMFYGISKNKRGKEFSDYDRYKPWDTEEFSGKLTYTLDDGKKYEIFRDFNKKNPKIYNERLEDISKEFNINKLTGNEFFIEQTKIDENMFLSTLVSMQQEVKLDKTSQNVLIQKVANFASTGDDNISYKKAIEKINKKQIEEIGTERSQGRPINIIKELKEKIENEKKELINFKNKQYEIEEIKNKIEKEIIDDENKLKLIKEINIIKEKQKIENEKINLNKKIISENEEEIKKLNLEKNKIEEEIKNKELIFEENNLINNNKNKFINELNFNDIEKQRIDSIQNKIDKIESKNRKLKILLIAMCIVMIVITIIDIMFTKTNWVSKIAISTIPIGFLVYIITVFVSEKNIKTQKEKLEQEIQEKNELTKRQNNEEIQKEKNELNKIKTQIEILEKNISNQKLNIEKIIQKNNLELNLEKEKIKNNYLEKLDFEKNNELINNKINSEENNNLIKEKIKLEINNYFNNNLNDEINFLENKLNKNKLEIHSLELDKNNLIPKLEKLSSLEEQLEELKEKEENLLKDNEAIELLKEVLEIAYNKMKDSVTPKFTNNLSKNIEKISNGKYKNVRVNDEEGIIVEKENGEYISAEKLSVGTIEQLYLSLRFAMISEISEENMPIILDEAFAYYDTERLTNILKYLYNEFKDKQILIFTCTDREKEILEKQKIKYNLIQL